MLLYNRHCGQVNHLLLLLLHLMCHMLCACADARGRTRLELVQHAVTVFVQAKVQDAVRFVQTCFCFQQDTHRQQHLYGKCICNAHRHLITKISVTG